MSFPKKDATKKGAQSATTGPATVRRVDDRVRYLIENAVECNHRCIFALVGDESKTQVVNLHYILTKARGGSDNQVNVLWCMKKELAFGGMSRKRRLEQNKKEKLSGRIVSASTHENFENFLSQTNIRYCFYKESKKIIGNTYGMVILQDFESLTPDVLARVIETASGGGIVLFMMRALNSLERLHSLLVKGNSKPSLHGASNFQNRLIRSFAECRSFLCIDDGLNILPITAGISKLQKDVHTKQRADSRSQREKRDELQAAISRAHSDTPAQLHNLTLTYEQGVAQLSLARAITEQRRSSLKNVLAHSLKPTVVSLIARRGRGKSAALGLSIAYALHENMTRILVLAPSVTHTVTLFDFAIRGLKALGYTEHVDFERFQCTSEDESLNAAYQIVFTGKKAIQKVELLAPLDVVRLSSASQRQTTLPICDLLVIDEGGSLSADIVQFAMRMAPLTFMAITCLGLEATGFPFSENVFRHLGKVEKDDRNERENPLSESSSLCQNKQILLHEPIRYALNDPIEEWLNKLFCFPFKGDSCVAKVDELISLRSKPHPDKCRLMHVSKKELFSYTGGAETYLRKVMLVLFYGERMCHPDDLQVLCDSPNHQLFALVGPSLKETDDLDVLCVMQVYRKQCDDESTEDAGTSENDSIFSTLSSYYDESDCLKPGGLQVVKIATHPEARRCGYASQAITLLAKSICASEQDKKGTENAEGIFRSCENADFLHSIQYIGARFWANTELFQFWSRLQFTAVYLDQMASPFYGEHSIIMMRSLRKKAEKSGVTPPGDIVERIQREFSRRYLCLATSVFRVFPLDISVAIALHGKSHWSSQEEKLAHIQTELTMADFSRLRNFIGLKTDFGRITDLVPRLAKLFFMQALSGNTKDSFSGSNNRHLNSLMITILMGVGIHGHSLDYIITQRPFANTAITIFQLRTLVIDTIEILTGHLIPFFEDRQKQF
ncbi:hypothetical protein XU18_1179 [Perkinsela sp. CCAP 1560/4]|nr:hypothetical protein XU18_1179 [Perkinsela sp. CCAP 1560/4]|eukprot:KNH08278.1 hypothetical protein XU18_1179 [Perkinsela sp. CCAP 1560/4]